MPTKPSVEVDRQRVLTHADAGPTRARHFFENLGSAFYKRLGKDNDCSPKVF